jgi:hypothetical protein
LTTPSSFGRVDLRPSSFNEDKTSSARRQSLLGVAFSAARKVGDPTSDAFVAPRVYLMKGNHRAPESLQQTLASTRSCFPDPKRLPSTNALSTCADRARHRTCDFASRRPASDALSLLLMLSREGARSSTVVTGYSPEVVSDHAPLVDFCNRNEMRAQPPDRPIPARHVEVALNAVFNAGSSRPLSKPSRPRFHGPGAAGINPKAVSPPRSLATRALSQPDRLGHLLSLTCARRSSEEHPSMICPRLRALSAGSPS